MHVRIILEGEERSRNLRLALLIYLVVELISICVLSQYDPITISVLGATLPLTIIVVNWGCPLLAVFLIEKGSLQDLGLGLHPEYRGVMLLFAIILLGGPVLLLGWTSAIRVELMEQVLYMGLMEEYFYRGYLMERFVRRFGQIWGLFLSAFIFGITHIFSRLALHDFRFDTSDIPVGIQTLIAGLIFGLAYQRFRSIWPGAIMHVAVNTYLFHYLLNSI